MFASIILETDSSWWLLALFAVSYGLAVMAGVIALLFKASQEREGSSDCNRQS